MESTLKNHHEEVSTSVPPGPPQKSRRGRKRVTDPVLANELKRHRRSRANDRERTRMRLLNEALEHLRTLLPMDASAHYSSADSSSSGPMIEDKLTKIETLRTASAYIRLLTDLLEQDSPSRSTVSMNPYECVPSHGHFYSTASHLSYPSSYSSYYHPYC